MALDKRSYHTEIIPLDYQVIFRLSTKLTKIALMHLSLYATHYFTSLVFALQKISQMTLAGVKVTFGDTLTTTIA